jgi:Mg/Co/Ni transporter MgtE
VLKKKAALFSGVEIEIVQKLIEDLPNEEVVEIIEQMPKDDVADLLGKIPIVRSNALLDLMSKLLLRL